MEAMIYPNTLDINKMIRYNQLLDDQGILKTNQKLKEEGIGIDWWPHLQTKCKKDVEEFGIDRMPQQLDKILLGSEEKFIIKMYNYLLKFDREEEAVKLTG
uniref:Uncharacterized protein n=1 Tax=Micrurus paraensis TaxID=1970185 RepID=A0A2D4KK41_9SAUR